MFGRFPVRSEHHAQYRARHQDQKAGDGYHDHCQITDRASIVRRHFLALAQLARYRRKGGGRECLARYGLQ